jgi:diguanylate cyclase (GGDEF)-like protein
VLVVEGDPFGGTRIDALLAGGTTVDRQGVSTTLVRDVPRGVRALSEQSWDAVLLSLSQRTAVGQPHRAVRALAEAAGVAPLIVLAENPDDHAELLGSGATEVLRLGEHHGSEAQLVARAVSWAVERRDLERSLDQASEQRLKAAWNDATTELPNHAFVRHHLRSLLERSRHTQRPLAALALDLDRFKPINDSLGPAAGDRLLHEVARRLERSTRMGDVVGRKGGDEFTILLEGIGTGRNAALVARKVRAQLEAPFVIDGHELSITASVGIAVHPGDGDDPETLLQHADIAMYRAKELGGNGFQFFRPDMNEGGAERLALEQGLRRALERSEFVLHYQPQLDLSTRAICGTEALVRWIHPERGMVPPDQFIPLAEETGLIDPLGDWVLETACAQNKAWQDAGFPAVPVSVNFSARQFHDRRPVERVARALRHSGLDACYLDLELTESAVMRDAQAASATLGRLRDLGVGVSIDDFGTGHSSLGYLKRFPINRLKIDKTFIGTLLDDPRDAAITEAIIAMAHRLDMKAVAEGVENERQLDFLCGPGCDEVQGYFVSRPLPTEKAGEVLAGHRPGAPLPCSN